jgi:hypothetical protein
MKASHSEIKRSFGAKTFGIATLRRMTLATILLVTKDKV